MHYFHCADHYTKLTRLPPTIFTQPLPVSLLHPVPQPPGVLDRRVSEFHTFCDPIVSPHADLTSKNLLPPPKI